MTSRPSTAAPILAVFAIVLVTLGAYVGGYFCLGQCEQILLGSEDGTTAELGLRRSYASQQQADLFRPAARVEEWLRGSSVLVIRRL